MVNYLTHLTSIVPRLPPAIDGVGDYALNLARQLRQDFNIQTHFIVGNTKWNGAAEIDGFPVSQVSDRSPDALLDLLSTDRSSSILLHYVGYGYAQRGCPVWLVDGLQRWKSLFPKRSLVTMFHEVYASGPPWTSSFWLSPLQKNLAARLAQMSDQSRTSLQNVERLLSQLSSRQFILILSLPVFSTMGEAEEILSLANRQQRLVIFGTYGRRLPIYQNSHDILLQIIQKLEITEILDIGKLLPLDLTKICGVPVACLGEQPPSVINYLLLDAVAGVIDYPANILAKSTIFAAYCAHGLLPIVIGTKDLTEEVDGLMSGKHYWLPDWQTESLDMLLAQEIANNAYLWYQNHNLSTHARTLVVQLREYNSI
ncbi:MAG: glycosyltransferase family 1 protein [Nostoc sp.]|uniref:glycosyltransferase family 1 protein n=1 Tax=Nostoc sp. TaxID=1180 RepID=UPI002FEF41C5